MLRERQRGGEREEQKMLRVFGYMVFMHFDLIYTVNDIILVIIFYCRLNAMDLPLVRSLVSPFPFSCQIPYAI